MNTNTKSTFDIDKYLEDAETWEDEVILGLKNQRNMLFIVTAISLVIGLFSVVAVIALTPLKTVVPFVIEVDKSTGSSKILTIYDGDVKKLSIEEQLSKYFIKKYLVARESFNPNLDLDENYLLVQGLSEGKAFDLYKKRFIEDSDDNIFVKYGSKSTSVGNVTTSFLRSDTAIVNYSLKIIDLKGTDEIKNYNDIVTFKYTNVPTTDEERTLNPLGFKITEFRTDEAN
jgi:type IV secretion system protein VirB8